MLKRLVVLTVFLVAANVVSLSPKKAVDSKTVPGINKTQVAQSQQPSPSDSIAIPQSVYSTTFNDNAGQKTEKDGWDKAGVLANYLLVVIGIGGIFAALSTFRAIRDQVIEMRSTGKQTDLLIRENIAQSASLERSVAETARFASAVENVAKSLESTARASTETLQGLRKQMRAYLTVIIGGGTVQEREKNLRFDGKPLLLNTGLTPARNVRYYIKSAILPIPLPEQFDQVVEIDKESGGNTLGSHLNKQLLGVVEDFIPDEQVEDIKIGKGSGMYTWGIVTYEDIFGDTHTTKFCQQLTWFPDGTVFGYYIAGRNDED